MAPACKIGANRFNQRSKETWQAREQINPVRQQQQNGGEPKKFLVGGSELNHAQSWRTQRQDDKGIGVKNRQAAENSKDERVPLPCAQKVEVKKGNSCASRAAGKAGMAGNG